MRIGRGLRRIGVVAFGLAVITTQADAQQAQLVASGLSAPVAIAAAPGDSTHLYIAQQGGVIRRLNLSTGTLDAAAFADISSRVASSGEEGLLGLAFDPGYATNGRFYLNYVVPGGQWNNGVSRVSQFHFVTTSRKKRRRGTTTSLSEVVLLSFDQPQTNHNGGWIGFSPRADDANNLYIATGDGGSANDQGSGHIEPGGNAQNTSTLLGKMLRIHVDPVTGSVSIPSNNPLASAGTGRREIFTIGMRNPFRASFDRQTGDLFIGDVGQNAREEVDVQPASNPGGGENYGWRLREGTIATPTGNPVVGGDPPAGNVNPILDYGRSTGGTVIGGVVYRGTAIPSLLGKYVFGDYLADKIFTLDYSGGTASNFSDMTATLFPNGGLTNPVAFGEDAAGEIYIADIGSGKIFKIVP